MNKYRIYWVCQIIGWTLYGCLQLFLYSTAKSPDIIHILGEVLQVSFYILSTHFLRYALIRFRWLALNWTLLIPRVLALILLLSVLNYGFLIGYSYLTGELTARDFLPFAMAFNIVGPLIIYFMWALIYFTFHYFERYNNTLKYEAAAKEIELRNLRSQLNPHFIFNALNSIRALVDEDPVKSKNAITQLSNILRNSLSVDRHRLVTLSEELNVVKDYLELERIRYEERLNIEIDIDPKSTKYLIPPLMIQTLIENGIKHGISTLKNGGTIALKSKIISENLVFEIRNTGQFVNGKSGRKSGYGIRNTRKRLELIYGDQAKFKIGNESEECVLTKVVIPKSL